jgi:periplasmic divalent cation tolerance protein
MSQSPTNASSPAASTSLKLLLTTLPSAEVAERIAKTLVEESLCACVSLVPEVLSVYRWEKKLCSEKEILLLIKTVQGQLRRLEARLLALHPYEVPELIVLDPEHVGQRYLGWVQSECAKSLPSPT